MKKLLITLTAIFLLTSCKKDPNWLPQECGIITEKHQTVEINRNGGELNTYYLIIHFGIPYRDYEKVLKVTRTDYMNHKVGDEYCK